MLKKIIYGWFSLFFSLSSYAATWDNLQSFQWPTCNIPQNDWRIGVGIGIEYLNLATKVKTDFSKLGAVHFGGQDQTQKNIAVVPSFELGKTSFNNYYTGIITNWHYSTVKKESREPFKNKAYFTHKFKMAYYLNILAKLGYKLTPKMMTYVLVGPSIAKWSHITDRFKAQVLEESFKMTKTSVGLGLGLGLEYMFCNGLAISMDYTHQFYKAEKTKKYMKFIDEIPNNRVGVIYNPRSGIVSKKVTPSSDAVVVRLSYFF